MLLILLEGNRVIIDAAFRLAMNCIFNFFIMDRNRNNFILARSPTALDEAYLAKFVNSDTFEETDIINTFDVITPVAKWEKN